MTIRIKIVQQIDKKSLNDSSLRLKKLIKLLKPEINVIYYSGTQIYGQTCLV